MRGRERSVPGGVPLAFPLVHYMGEPSDCAGFMEVAKGSAVLDGEKVEAEEHRGTSVSVRGVADNPVTGSGGSFTATGCGLWVQLEPLEPGPHTLTIRGESADFSVAADYSLNVKSASS
ncbi:hypothetical protein [Streptomyces sp. NPDC060027]|uniref:hypothetical protein n=1 Tax=Streptomyces sp. NPDC060027 TaxID=3347040 RepID=UPI0036C35384